MMSNIKRLLLIMFAFSAITTALSAKTSKKIEWDGNKAELSS